MIRLSRTYSVNQNCMALRKRMTYQSRPGLQPHCSSLLFHRVLALFMETLRCGVSPRVLWVHTFLNQIVVLYVKDFVEELSHFRWKCEGHQEYTDHRLRRKLESEPKIRFLDSVPLLFEFCRCAEIET